jgi:hypothetical protein
MNTLRSAIPLAILIALTASNIFLIQSVSAVTAPTVPEFSVRFIPSSYSVTTTDPYTGQTTTTRNQNNNIEVTIKNQQAIDSTHQIYYNIHVRPHFEGDWVELYPLYNLSSAPYSSEIGDFPMSLYLYHADLPLARHTPMQSNDEYTVITFALNENNEYTPSPLINLPNNARVDFQVEAIVGHDAQYWYIQHPLYPTYGGLYQDSVAYDNDSGWSSTQTITVGTDSTTVFITDLASNWEENNWIVVAASTVIIVAIIAVAAVLIKRAKTQAAT